MSLQDSMGQRRALHLLELELDSCKLSCGLWEWNLSPLEEQPLVLNPQPSLPPLRHL